MVWNNTFIRNNGATETFDSSHVQAFDDGSANSWNSTDGYGNYWSDWTAPDILQPSGIVDAPYDVDGCAGTEDHFPLTSEHTPIPEFGLIPLVVMSILVMSVMNKWAWTRKLR